MAKVGRPTKYRRKFCQVAYDFLSQGYSKEALAGELGISRQCLYEWLEKNQEFGDTVSKAEAKAQFIWEKYGQDAVQGKIKGFNTSVWMFVMKNRFGWKERESITFDQEPITGVAIMAPLGTTLPES